MTDDQIIDGILEREGGYVDHPADKGGPTNFGITQAALSAHRNASVTVEDVKNLTAEEARAIYRADYIEGPELDSIKDDPLRALVVDCAVNHGPMQAVKMLQRALGVAVDGVVGKETREALTSFDAKRAYLRVCGERARLFGKIITKNPTQAVFAAGWMNRLAEFIEQA